jgi:hypothetical protein
LPRWREPRDGSRARAGRSTRLYWWPIPRLLVRGDFRYIIVKPEKAEASVTDGRAAAIYHPWPHFGAMSRRLLKLSGGH